MLALLYWDEVDNAFAAPRLHCLIRGIEWTMYNRTAAYDSIIRDSQMDTEDGKNPTDSCGKNEEQELNRAHSMPVADPTYEATKPRPVAGRSRWYFC